MRGVVCYLDLDGVLVDFIRGALRVHNKELPIEDVRWDFHEQVGIPNNEFWEPMGFDFWANLDWMGEGQDLLRGIEGLFGESVVLLTSPCLTVGSVEGKVDWVKRNIPGYQRRLFVGPAKHLLASHCKVLVDDHDVNVDKFREHGGKAILVPRPWNSRRKDTISGNFNVEKLLGEIQDEMYRTAKEMLL